MQTEKTFLQHRGMGPYPNGKRARELTSIGELIQIAYTF